MDIQKIKMSAALASAQWHYAQAEARRDDAGDAVAGLGRWWLERAGAGLVLSNVAARFLGVDPQAGRTAQLANVEPADRAAVALALDRIAAGAAAADCEFRVRIDGEGLRWLRLRQVDTLDGGMVVAGILQDVTAAKHAAARERFNFTLTQYLVGTDSIDEAVVKILRLVCEELGWEWGAFWALDGHEDDNVALLRCRYSWQAPRRALAPFKRASLRLAMGPGQGLIGAVWAGGEARWIEDAAANPDLVRAAIARDCGLQSAYFFPVTFVASDGRLVRPGVLEFFSELQRQHDAQLPILAESISAMIAQAVERMTQQERIRVRAQTDEMTGLANRAHFHDLLDGACRQAAGEPFGVLYVDLDQFKPINDAFGHEAGNVVLTEFAKRLCDLAPPGWRIGRLGGDEFALLSAPGATRAELERVSAAVLEAARRRFGYRGHRLAVSASIGIATHPEHGNSTRELLHAADAAMYLSKRNGRNAVSCFDGAGGQPFETARHLGLLSDLHYAIRRDEFFLEYQPICASADLDLVGVEALIRWRRPDGELVPPDVFIPLAEQSRLIVDIGRWVVRQVCHDLAALHRAGVDLPRVHVNMAAPEFGDEELPERLLAIAAAARVDPRHLCLELTEGAVMQHADKAGAIMRALRRLGFEIGLDDFGMGYSSLSVLKTLPIDSLKIDRVFMAGVPGDRDDCAIVRSILDLGRHMKLRVIAEGVETDAQLSFLRQFGCAQVQGFLPGRPMALAQLVAQRLARAEPARAG